MATVPSRRWSFLEYGQERGELSITRRCRSRLLKLGYLASGSGGSGKNLMWGIRAASSVLELQGGGVKIGSGLCRIDARLDGRGRASRGLSVPYISSVRGVPEVERHCDFRRMLVPAEPAGRVSSLLLTREQHRPAHDSAVNKLRMKLLVWF